MARRLERILFALAGAIFGATVAAFVEARTVVFDSGTRVSTWSVAIAEGGVLFPLALVIGLGVSIASLYLEPAGPVSFSVRVADVRRQPVLARSRIAALAPLVCLASTVWLVGIAHLARSFLARGAPMAAGVALSAVSLVAMGGLWAIVLVILPWLRRTLALAASSSPRAIDPMTTGALGLAVGAAAIWSGAALGDTGGGGPTPLALFGVLRRHELDLRPLVDLGVMAICAWLTPLAALGRRPRRARSSMAGLVVLAAIGLTVHEAVALEADPSIALLIEAHAPLGRVALAIDRKATDRDGDGASPYFGGGDCDDHNPSVSPLAVEIPGNSVDEDCSGADGRSPRVAPAPAPAVTPRGIASSIGAGLNVILITVDTLRATEVGFLGYDKPTTPNLDAFAAASVVFERAYAMASYTGKALAPMLIGKYPSETLRDGGHFTKYFAGNVFVAERLRAAGLLTIGAASQWYFREPSGLEQGFDHFDLSAMPSSSQGDTDTASTSPALTDAAIRLISTFAMGKRFFLWVHYFDPHAQYVPHAGAPDFADAAKPPGWKTRALYDGEIWFTDREIGRLLEYARRQPWGANTAIVLTSDHGESMGEHGIAFQHGFEIWESLVRVPLVVFVPGLTPHRVPQKRSVIDVVPTMLEIARVPQPPAGELSGQSLLPDLSGPPGGPFDERDVYIDMPDGPYTHLRRGLIHGTTPGMKLIHMGGRQYRLYDLATDPEELNDLAGDPSRLRPMIEAMAAKRASLKEILVKPDTPGLP